MRFLLAAVCGFHDSFAQKPVKRTVKLYGQFCPPHPTQTNYIRRSESLSPTFEYPQNDSANDYFNDLCKDIVTAKHVNKEKR